MAITLLVGSAGPAAAQPLAVASTSAVVITKALSISGTAEVGSIVKDNAGAWRPAAVALSYQCLREDKAISGATKSAYRFVAADAGKKVSVKVTGSRNRRCGR